MDFDRLRRLTPIGTVIPKPEARDDFIVVGWGRRRGEQALIYSIPNHKNPAKPYKKGIALSEFRKAYGQLTLTGEFSRSWFNKEMAACAREGGCNFTTIGGLFCLLGYASYQRAAYVRI